MLPMTGAELAAILSNPIGTLTPSDLTRIQQALSMFSQQEGTLGSRPARFPAIQQNRL